MSDEPAGQRCGALLGTSSYARYRLDDLTRESPLARKTIYVSDITGKPIDDKDAATVTIRYADVRRGVVVLDANANEVSDLASKGRKQARRGRPPKSAT
jgi:hypothetical protein